MTTAAPFYTLKQETRHERRTIDKTLRAFKIWVIYKQDNLLCEFDEEATEQEARAVLAALQFAHIKTSREHLLELLKEAAEETQDYKEGGFLTRDDGTAKNPGKWHEEAKALFPFGADEQPARSMEALPDYRPAENDTDEEELDQNALFMIFGR